MATIDIIEGLDDTDEGIMLRVSGDAEPRIHLTPQGQILAGDGGSPPASLNARIAAAPATPAIRPGNWVGAAGQSGTNAVTLNLLMMHAIVVAPGTAIDRIGCEITTGAASAVVRMGIWLPNEYAEPVELVHETPTPHDASSTGFLQDVVSDVVVPESGLLVVGAVPQVALPTFRTFAPGQGVQNITNDGSTIASHSPGLVGYDANETGALPDVPSVSHGSATFFTRLWLRAA